METLKMVREFNYSDINESAKEEIFELANIYSKNYNVDLNSLLMFATDVFLLGKMYGRKYYENVKEN